MSREGEYDSRTANRCRFGQVILFLKLKVTIKIFSREYGLDVHGMPSGPAVRVFLYRIMKAVNALKGVPRGTTFPSGGVAPEFVVLQTGNRKSGFIKLKTNFKMKSKNRMCYMIFIRKFENVPN